MHIIIPMSGVGKRFVDAGYTVPKPLIEIDGKPIIEHVCNLFPGETKFTFICNAKHLAETNMRSILEGIQPNGNIIEIPNHKKGPVYAVSLINHLIEDDEEVIVNYCDFGTYWDYQDFLRHSRERNADGAIPAYKGFHPHMLGTTNYAFMRDDEQWMLEIKEKEPFTDNRMQEYASNGTYYFKKGKYVKKYFKQLMDEDIQLKGEYYVSLIYNLLVRDGLKVSIYHIQHMLQWGTPGDVEEYNRWSEYFNAAIQPIKKNYAAENSLLLIPLAGHGSRFAKKGYKDPKPLISVSGKPMIVQAAASLPNTEAVNFVTLQEHLNKYALKNALLGFNKDAKIIPIQGVTEGQAITCQIGIENEDKQQSLLIAATDNGMLYNDDLYQEYINDPSVDGIVFTFKHHPSSRENPQMYGWVRVEGDKATGVSVKIPISDDPFNDHAIVGTFYFRTIALFEEALEKLIRKNERVNGEYYVDSLIGEMIDLDKNIKVLEVDQYIGWGTPDDYETFRYWQSFFHKCEWHPYRLEKDPTVEGAEILDQEAYHFEQEWR